MPPAQNLSLNRNKYFSSQLPLPPIQRPKLYSRSPSVQRIENHGSNFNFNTPDKPVGILKNSNSTTQFDRKKRNIMKDHDLEYKKQLGPQRISYKNIMKTNEDRETPFEQEMKRFQFLQEPSMPSKKVIRRSNPILLPVIQRPNIFAQVNKYDVVSKKSFFKDDQPILPKKLANVKFKSPKRGSMKSHQMSGQPLSHLKPPKS